jgi:outer membrane receptor for ferrienterochelin and colicins
MALARPSFIAASFIFSAWQAFAAGSVTGHVTASGEKGTEPLTGVTVLVQGTVRGTTTNLQGEFRIAGIPAGNYTLVFSMVGYQREVRSGIAIEEGKETVVDVTMIQTPIPTEQIVVTANRRQQSLQEVPVSISVMDAKEIEDRNAQTLDDALRYIPGVNITGFQLNIRGSSGYSRGAGSRVLMLLDGIPFITGDTGELNFESIPIGQVDRIEVVKGASSALYGSSALGGVINVITKPIAETPETIIRSYVGLYNKPSFGEWHWSDRNRYYNGESISHSSKSGDLGIVLFASRQFDDGYRQNDYRRRYNVYLKTREDYAGGNSLTLNFGLLYQYGGQFLYWRNLDSALIPPLLQINDNVKSIRYYTSGTLNNILSDNLFLSTKILWYHNDWGFETIHQYGRNESVSDELNLDASSTWIPDKNHTVTLGLNADMFMVGADIFGNHVGGGLALYGQDEWKLAESVTFTLGTRFDYQALGLSGTNSQINPKAGVTYTPAPGTVLRASFGRGFRVPSVAEAFLTGEVSGFGTVPNADLRPERSLSYEVGVSQSLGDVGALDVAGFRSDFDDLIEPGIVVSSSTLAYIQWRNVTKARVQGVETSFRLGLFGGDLQYNVGYTYVYPENRANHTILKYRPRHLLYTNATARMGPFSLGGDFRYVSRVDQIDTEFVQLGIIPDADERVDIFVTDFRAGFDFSFADIPVSATFEVNNAFQRNYIELIGNLMPPRTYVIVLEARP